VSQLADFQAMAALDRQVRTLERQQQQRAGTAQNWDAYQFTVSPTCPPSTSVFFRGGRYSFTAHSTGYLRNIHNSTFDFVEDTDDVYRYWPYTCVNTDWYVPVYMGLCWYGDYDRYTDGYTDNPQFALFGADYRSWTGGGFVEYETTGEAEEAINGVNPSFYQDHIREATIPLCRLVLRISAPGSNQFMSIDAVNRGQGYLWGQFRDGRYSL